MAASPLFSLNQPRLRSLDPAYRDNIHVGLLVSIWVLFVMAKYSDVDSTRRFCSRVSHHHHAAPCADHTFALGNADC